MWAIGGSDEGAERLLLAFKELASNALRPGGVTAFGGCSPLEVSDAAADPARGRTPSTEVRACTRSPGSVPGTVGRATVTARAAGRAPTALPRPHTRFA